MNGRGKTSVSVHRVNRDLRCATLVRPNGVRDALSQREPSTYRLDGLFQLRHLVTGKPRPVGIENGLSYAHVQRPLL
jgi:hypothetical protein